MIAFNISKDSSYHPVVIKDKQEFWKRILIVDLIFSLLIPLGWIDPLTYTVTTPIRNFIILCAWQICKV
ncbi:MAG TPA: hypothetical protein VEH06_15490 [Candidatus Bathyarchaeia archaeon]|nr:hypothetical protein [Candidatus Bathyarchaeia archaeon]